MQYKKTIKAAVIESFPLALAIATYGVSYGMLGVSANLKLIEIMLMSVFVFSGSVQLIVVAMLMAGSSISSILLTVLLLNLRNLLYGASLASGLSGAGKWRHLLAFGVSDEPFVLGQARFLKVGPDPLYYGVITLVFYVAWQAASFIGAILGNQLDPALWGLDLAFPMTFIALLMPSLRGKPILVTAFSAIVISAFMINYNPQNQLVVVIVGLIAPLIGVLCTGGEASV